MPGPHNLLVPVTPVLTSMPSSEVTCDSASIPGLESAKIKVDVVQNLPSTVSPMHTSAIADGSCSSLDEPKSVLRNNYGRANENTEQCTAGLSSELGGEHTTNVDVFAYSEAELDAMRREEAYWNSIKQSETTHHLNEVNREVVMHGDTNPWYDAPDTYYSENRRNGDPHNCILQ